MVAVVPLTNVAAVAQSQAGNIHWGQSPYYPNCVEGPCRVVLIADKTGEGTFQGQIQRWVAWMNYVRVNYNLKLPAFGYVGPAQGLQPDPGCAVANGVISVCRNAAVINADCNTSPDTLRCTSFNVNLGNNHILWSKSSFRPRALDPADVWTIVCAALGRSIGIPPSGDPNSCLQDNITLGTGQEKYYVTADWLTLFSLYDHPAGT
jgi:hypothetical protein